MDGRKRRGGEYSKADSHVKSEHESWRVGWVKVGWQIWSFGRVIPRWKELGCVRDETETETEVCGARRSEVILGSQLLERKHVLEFMLKRTVLGISSSI